MNHDEPSFLMDSTVENCTPDAMILPVLGCQVGAGQNNHLQLETTWDVWSRTPIVLYHFVSVKFIFRKLRGLSQTFGKLETSESKHGTGMSHDDELDGRDIAQMDRLCA